MSTSLQSGIVLRLLVQRLQHLQPCNLAAAASGVQNVPRQHTTNTVQQSPACHPQQQHNVRLSYHNEQQQSGCCPRSWLVQLNCSSHHQHSHAQCYSVQAAHHRRNKRPKHPSSGSTSRSIPQLPESIDWDQQQQGQLQKQRQEQTSLAMQQQQQIPEGELMALIAAASSITDIERLVMHFHTQFK